MPYIPPHARKSGATVANTANTNSFAALSDENDYPTLAGAPKPVIPKAMPGKEVLTFAQRVKEAEEERLREQEAAIYDPAKLETLNKEQLERHGWALLSLRNPYVQTFAQQFNEQNAHADPNPLEDWLQMPAVSYPLTPLPADYGNDDESIVSDASSEEDDAETE
jgi:hypothetical protein